MINIDAAIAFTRECKIAKEAPGWEMVAKTDVTALADLLRSACEELEHLRERLALAEETIEVARHVMVLKRNGMALNVDWDELWDRLEAWRAFVEGEGK